MKSLNLLVLAAALFIALPASAQQSYAAVAEKTKNLKNGEPNPHASHHYGEGIACTACHSEHKTSQVYCNNCHEFKYQIK